MFGVGIDIVNKANVIILYVLLSKNRHEIESGQDFCGVDTILNQDEMAVGAQVASGLDIRNHHRRVGETQPNYSAIIYLPERNPNPLRRWLTATKIIGVPCLWRS
jgi:hypothetical protein